MNGVDLLNVVIVALATRFYTPLAWTQRGRERVSLPRLQSRLLQPRLRRLALPRSRDLLRDARGEPSRFILYDVATERTAIPTHLHELVQMHVKCPWA